MKWKVGDRVKVVSNDPYCAILNAAVGLKGTIINTDKTHGVLVEFDENVDGHHGNVGEVTGRYGHCWWFDIVDGNHNSTLYDFSSDVRLAKVVNKKNNYW